MNKMVNKSKSHLCYKIIFDYTGAINYFSFDESSTISKYKIHCTDTIEEMKEFINQNAVFLSSNFTVGNNTLIKCGFQNISEIKQYLEPVID